MSRTFLPSGILALTVYLLGCGDGGSGSSRASGSANGGASAGSDATGGATSTASAGGAAGTSAGGAAGTSAGGAAGVGGSGGAEPCASVSCDEPQEAVCVGNHLWTYQAPGTCVEGSCSYPYTENDCPFGCSAGACLPDPCSGVTCDMAPAKRCISATTLSMYSSPGSCAGGQCIYPFVDQGCAFGCEGGACQAGPCEGVTCNTAPAKQCVGPTTLRSYAASGTCSFGTCSYVSTEESCPFGCANGACQADPCTGVVCNTPPPSACASPGSSTLVTYSSPGSCNAGTCKYSQTYVQCTAACESGVCDPNGLWRTMHFTAQARTGHTAVWTGSRMIIYGGRGTFVEGTLGTGEAYQPLADAWLAIPGGGKMQDHTAVWTGSEMILWGGFADSVPVGGVRRYTPATKSWAKSPPAVGDPAPRSGHTAVWTGSEMIVWGGVLASGVSPATYLDSGGRYDPQSNTWTLLPTTGAPDGRTAHSAVWTGSEMLVWGGMGSANLFGTGARYRPSTNTWTAMSSVGAPAPRSGHAAVWTGSEMIVWGGGVVGGARYNPSTDAWTTLPSVGAPQSPRGLTAIWTGSEMIVWGGTNTSNSVYYGNGARLNPATNTWSPLPTLGVPEVRAGHTAVWTGSEMLIWGGQNSNSLFYSGGRYSSP